jgi:16S rRNA (uracil1498-N3)-methyltransferase
LRDVLRLRAGDAVTAFDDTGAIGAAIVTSATAENVTIRIDKIVEAAESTFEWTIAAAVPKGQRADWMVEKLAELGTQSLIPLSAARSVSIPGGKEKPARWERLAAEASRQSGRAGVMRIEPVLTVAEIVEKVRGKTTWCLSTEPDSEPLLELTNRPPPKSLVMLVGPEGGWTDDEIALFRSCGIKSVKLAGTILRVETAAVAAAAVIAAWKSSRA